MARPLRQTPLLQRSKTTRTLPPRPRARRVGKLSKPTAAPKSPNRLKRLRRV
jgi:hypothetical protein